MLAIFSSTYRSSEHIEFHRDVVYQLGFAANSAVWHVGSGTNGEKQFGKKQNLERLYVQCK